MILTWKTKNWTPIGNGYNYINNNGYGIDDDTAYNGIFDGKGHSISGLFIETKKYNKQGDNHYETYCQGFFGIIGKEGTVRNVTVNGQINAQAEGNEYINAAKYIGGIAGINADLIYKLYKQRRYNRSCLCWRYNRSAWSSI